MSHYRRHFALVTIAFLSLAACSGPGGDNLTIEHVHGIAVDGAALYVATHHGLYVNEGGEWTQRSEDKADHMGFSLISETLMFRSGHPETGGNLGVQRSTDGGRTWALMSNVLDSPVDFHAMAASRDDRRTLYGSFQGLFRSERDPESWERVQSRGLPQQVAALTAGVDGVVYASTPAGLYRSTNRGETWKSVSDELVFALAAGGDPEVLYASRAEGDLPGRQGTGVLRSTDGGRKWKDMSDGLDASGVIVALGASRDGRTVVAADQSSGIWKSSNRGESWTRVPTP